MSYTRAMIRDHRPYYIKRAYLALERWYGRRFIAPQMAGLGIGAHLMKPWHIRLSGAHIEAGKNLHVVTAADRKVSLSTWAYDGDEGHIRLGDNCLICPGVRLDSASAITIGDNCMLAAGVYITDADWHDLYDRTRPVGTTTPVTLEDNVWIGDGAVVCKGVTIGRNAIIGAGAIVTGDIPADTIAAGNPARVVKQLDPARAITTRAAIFTDPAKLARDVDQIDRYILKRNSLWGWLRSILSPRRGD